MGTLANQQKKTKKHAHTIYFVQDASRETVVRTVQRHDEQRSRQIVSTQPSILQDQESPEL